MSNSLKELYFSRLREFYRQPARIFWVYGFPMILAIGLGLAFRNPPNPSVALDLVVPSASTRVEAAASPESFSAEEPVGRLLRLPGVKPQGKTRLLVPGRDGRPSLDIRFVSADEGAHRIKAGKTALLVIPKVSGPMEYRFDPTRPEASAARSAFDDALQSANGRKDLIPTTDDRVSEKGSRYIDFLIPGLIGQNTMGGGLWGVGFLLVNFRIMKLLKRFMATPMPRRDFLLAILGARLTFLIPDVGVLLALGYWGFGMPIRGNLGLVILLEVVGALAFAGIGLLIASRAKTTETVSGLMNLVMLPMWIFSGLFFSADRFEGPLQWFAQILPLTHLLSALRAVILGGSGISDPVVSIALIVLSAWAFLTFYIALRIFRWT
jgi:ABC-2 type transport system permease protein